MNKKILAFTLAETLIVMAVIGIVSGLTLPNLNNSTHQKKEISKLKKFYAELSDAWSRTESVYGKYSEWDEELQDLKNEQEQQTVIMNRLLDFFKVTGMKFENGRIKGAVLNRWVYYLPNGYVMYIEPNNKDEDDVDDSESICSVNNSKNYGKLKVWELNDFRAMQNNNGLHYYAKGYYFWFTEEGFIPFGSQMCGTLVDEDKWNNCVKKKVGYTCTGTLIEY